MIWAVDTNSTDEVGLGADQLGHQLAGTEVWSGNNIADELVNLPGLVGLIHSKLAAPATTGGDVYYLSVCDESVSRVVLADVAGHGEAVAGTALKLRTLLKKYINMFDQSALMREINEAFRSENEDLARYATAAVLSYYCKTGVLVFANVGHPPALWYHRNEKTWDWLDERTPHTVNVVAGLPLGLIHGTEYEQTAVHLAEGDLLILYTDGITECADDAAKELGSEGLLTLLRRMTVEPSIETADALVAAVEKFRGSTSCLDDQSVIVLQRTVGCRHVTTGWPKTNYLV
jgi:serine phosphatase RsbU (regulator of sigma subunit)